MNKKELRVEVRKRLSALDEGEKAQKSTMLALALVSSMPRSEFLPMIHL